MPAKMASPRAIKQADEFDSVSATQIVITLPTDGAPSIGMKFEYSLGGEFVDDKFVEVDADSLPSLMGKITTGGVLYDEIKTALYGWAIDVGEIPADAIVE